MKLSIIIPVYNSSKYLERCLNSIVEQSFDDYEIIIVDDESSDNSMDIINDFINNHSNINITSTNIKHSGSSIARKKAIELATGDYIGFVDSDDYINKDYFKTLINEIGDNDIIASDIVIGKTIKRNNYKDDIVGCQQAKLAILNQKAIYQYLVNKIYRKELFNNISFPISDMIAEDFMITMQLIENATNIKMINDNPYYYNINDQSQSRSGFCDKHRNMYQEFNKLLANSKDDDEDYLNSLKRYILIHYMAILVAMSRNKKYDQDMINNILEFVKENKKDYLQYSNDSLTAKTAVIVASYNYKLFDIIARMIS